MTDENRFFRYIWRFNALVVACIGLAAAWTVAGGLLNPFRPEPPPKGGFAPVPRGAEQGFTYRLDGHGQHRLVGQEELIALNRWKGSPETYGLKHMEVRQYSSTFVTTNSVNLLAVDQKTAHSHWVFAGYNRAIIADDAVYDTVPVNPAQTPAQASALVITVVDADTDKDGELTDKDKQSLYVYRPGMPAATRLLAANLILSTGQAGNDRYLVVL